MNVFMQHVAQKVVTDVKPSANYIKGFKHFGIRKLKKKYFKITEEKCNRKGT